MAEDEDRAGDAGREDDPRDYREPDEAVAHVMSVRPLANLAEAKDKLLARYGDGSGTIKVWASETNHAGEFVDVLMYNKVAWERSRWNMRDVRREFPLTKTDAAAPEPPRLKQPAVPQVEAGGHIPSKLLPIAEKGIQLIASHQVGGAHQAALILLGEARAAGAVRQRTTDTNAQNRISKAIRALQKRAIDNPKTTVGLSNKSK